MTPLKTKRPGDPVFKLTDKLESTASFDRKVDMTTIREFIRREKFTGTLSEDISLGGTTRIRFVQKQDVDVV